MQNANMHAKRKMQKAMDDARTGAKPGIRKRF